MLLTFFGGVILKKYEKPMESTLMETEIFKKEANKNQWHSMAAASIEKQKIRQKWPFSAEKKNDAKRGWRMAGLWGGSWMSRGGS